MLPVHRPCSRSTFMAPFTAGLDVHAPILAPQLRYLKEWGAAVRRALETLRSSRASGFFAPSCLAHASNLRFSTAPPVRGVRLSDAMRAWYFHGNGSDEQYVADDCGDLPCADASVPSHQCPRLQSVRACHALCRLHRRRRRIRIGLDPSAPGRHVCELDVVAARQSQSSTASRGHGADGRAVAGAEGQDSRFTNTRRGHQRRGLPRGRAHQ